MKDTLYQRLREHQALEYSSFHTPGHKCSGFFPKDLTELDLTELPDTDALFESEGIILEAEKKLSALFGAGASLISAGGCTLAIQAMLRVASSRGNRIVMGRNAHRSAVNACALLGTEPVWVMPRSSDGLFTGRVTPEDVEEAFRRSGGASACYITSPDYYGEISDIEGISQVCRRYGALLLVDNAHGSHLAFMKDNMHPIARGADMTACSMHKTLPVLTGGAVLNIADGELFVECRSAMALFGSTSPSYPIMASIDLCRDFLQNGGAEKYRTFESRVGMTKKRALDAGLVMPEGLCDPLRVCVNTALSGLRGTSEQTEYFHGYRGEPEFCDGTNAVFICTPFNTENDMQRLEAALGGLSAAADRTVMHDRIGTVTTLPERLMLPRDAVLALNESVGVREAVGRISADSPCPCPPGIPVVMPGELIDAGVCELLLESGIETVRCVREAPVNG